MTIPLDALRGAYMDWFRSVDAQLAFTGSVKQSIASPLLGTAREYAAPDVVEKNIRQAMERASRAILGRKLVRQGQSLSYASIVEGLERPVREGGERLHVHLAIGGIPDGFPLERAVEIIEQQWHQSKWGYTDCQTRIIASQEDRNCWLAYGLKRLKTHNTERYSVRLSTKDADRNK